MTREGGGLGELRHGRVHRAGGDGSRHRLLVVARRAAHRARARRRVAGRRSGALRDPGRRARASCASGIRPPARAMRASTCSSPIWRPTAGCRSISAPRPTSIYRAWTGSRTAAASPCSARAATRRRSNCCASTRSRAAARVLLTERSEHWVPLHRELTFLQQSPQFIWASSRDGFQHLYLYGNDGNLIRQLTSGEFMVVGESPGARDSRRRRARAARLLHRQSALAHRAPAVLGVARCSPARRSACHQGAGWHSVAMSQDARVFVDTFSDANTPRSVTLRTHRRQRAGRRCSPTSSTPRIPTRRTSTSTCGRSSARIAAADGQAMHYKLLKPRNLEPGKRYPVLIDVYGGPGVQRVSQLLGQPVPSIPRAARLRGVRARQSRQRLARRALRDRARATHGRHRSAGPGEGRRIPAQPALRRRASASASSAGATAAT